MDRPRRYPRKDYSNQPSTKSKRSSNDNAGSDGIDHIGILPTTVLAKIIQLLPRAQWPHLESVNHSFQSAVYETWRKVKDINFEYDFVYNQGMLKTDRAKVLYLLLEKLLSRAPNTNSLDGFAAFSTITLDDEIIDLLSEFDRLERICFMDARMRSTALARLLSSNMIRSNLKELSLHRLFLQGESTSVQLAFGQQEGKQALQMEKFVYENTCLCENALDAFLNHVDATKLTTLSLDFTESNQATAISLLTRCTKLVDLKLEIRHNECGQILEAAATSPVLSALKLEFLGGERSVFYAAMENLIQNLGGRPCQLTELSLGTCNDNVVQAIGDHLQNLVKLEMNVFNCDNDAVKQLLMKLMRLEDLRFQWMTSNCLVEIAPFILDLTNLKHLGIHLIGGSPRHLGCADILSHLILLNELHLQVTSTHIGHMLTELAKNGGLPRLEQLHIEIHSNMEKEIIELLETLPALRRLRLMDYSGSTLRKMLMSAVAKSCPLLNELDLRGSDVTLNGIQTIIHGCPFLKKVQVKNSDSHNKWYPHELKVAKYRRIVFK